MKKDKFLHIQTKLIIKDNSQFLFFQNYIISVIQDNNQIQFYNTKSFKREFILKPRKKDDLLLNNYNNLKLLYKEDKNLYLMAYQEITNMYNNLYNNNLGIFKLKLEERKIEKIAYFTNTNFLDLKNNKVYIKENNSIIIYDILTNTSTEKSGKEYDGNAGKILVIDNFMLFISLQQIIRWTFAFYCKILDKNMDKLYKNYIFNCFSFDMDDYPDKYFMPIVDNYFLINSQIIENSTLLNIAEIEIKGKEKLIKSLEEDRKSLDDIGVFKRYQIEIKDIGELTFYPLDNEKLGINIANRNIYVFKKSGMKLIGLYRLNYYDMNEKLLLINAKEEKENYKLYLGNKNKMLVFSS